MLSRKPNDKSIVIYTPPLPLRAILGIRCSVRLSHYERRRKAAMQCSAASVWRHGHRLRAVTSADSVNTPRVDQQIDPPTDRPGTRDQLCASDDGLPNCRAWPYRRRVSGNEEA